MWNLGHALCTICGAKLVPDSICPRLWKFPIQQLQPLTSFRLFNSPRKTPVQRPPRSFFERGHCQLSSKGNIEQNLVQESAFSSYPPSFNLFVQDLNSYPPVESTHIRFKSDPDPFDRVLQLDSYATLRCWRAHVRLAGDCPAGDDNHCGHRRDMTASSWSNWAATISDRNDKKIKNRNAAQLCRPCGRPANPSNL